MQTRHRGYTLVELVIVLFLGAWMFIGIPTIIYVLYHFITKFW